MEALIALLALVVIFGTSGGSSSSSSRTRGRTAPLATPPGEGAGQLVYVHDAPPKTTSAPAPARASAPVAKTPSVASQLGSVGLATILPAVAPTVPIALKAAGTTLSTASANPLGGGISRPIVPAFQEPVHQPTFAVAGTESVTPVGKIGSSVGGALSSTGSTLGGATPLAAVFAASALTSGKFRGQSAQQQGAVLGQASLKTTETALGFVPVVGQAASGVLSLLAQTGEGKHVIAAVGASEEKVYQGQKLILKGDVSKGVTVAAQALSGGGSSHQERASKFYGAVLSTIQRLQKGGALDQNAVNGFRQAMASGDRYVGGFDLTKLDLSRAGTNPFLGKTSS